jgi:hypothetical protein
MSFFKPKNSDDASNIKMLPARQGGQVNLNHATAVFRFNSARLSPEIAMPVIANISDLLTYCIL